tara:strand:- start:230 stop:493 length:264 start_codon:yes stop_codon:yes gene_type:complete
MYKEGWLVRKDRILAMRFFQDKIADEDGTPYMRVHYAICEQRFLRGITPHVELYASERMAFEIARELWRSSLETDWEVSDKPLWFTR